MGIFVKGSKRSSAQGHMLDFEIPKDEKEFATDKGESISSPCVHALVSPAAEEVPIWNILPSYQLYESTFSKVMDPSIGDFDDEPPTYEDSPPSVGSSTENDYFTSQRGSFGLGPGHVVRTPEPRWENSILAHVHQMKHVDEFNKSIGSKLKIDIVLTRKPGALGRKPVTYNAQESEFSQGDSIHGYVVVTNKCDEPLNFDMFSVVFEGRMAVNSSETGTGTGTKPFLFYKFLNMFDYNASWTPAYFEETSSETISFTDPVDGTFLQFPFKRKLMPGVSYKKFFNFTIPLKLLDCACEVHEIPEHCVLFPSIGLDKSSFLQRLRKLRETKIKPERASSSASTSASARAPFTPGMRPSKPLSIRPSKPLSINPPVKKKSPNLITRDFGFPDTSISYSVETKLISKRSNYDKSCNTKNDEFVIVKDAGVPIRIIPRDINLPDTSPESFTAEKHYEAFLKSVQKCIDIGNRLQNGEELSKVRRKLSIAKQIYNAKANSRSNTTSTNDATYTVHFPYKKKQLAQAGRIVGLLNAHVPKNEHFVRYVTPYIFAPNTGLDTNKLAQMKVHIDLDYFNTENESKGVKPPDIRGVTAKIVICTLRSKKYPIPIEFTQEMKFRNVLGTNDTIEKYIITPFKTHLRDMTKSISTFGMQPLGINKQLLMDVKSLANLEFKSTSMKIDNLCVKSKGGLGVWKVFPNSRRAENSIDIDIDVQSLFTKDSKRPMEHKLKGALTLVPTFQSCIMCRYYYLLIEIKLGNGEALPVKIPFKIAK